MRVDRLLQRGRIVGLAVALHAQVMGIGPGAGRRQRPHRARRGGRRTQRLGLPVGAETAHAAKRVDRQAVVERLDAVARTLPRDRLAAVAEAGEGRRVEADRIVEPDLGEAAVLGADDHRRLADILEADVLAPQRIRIALVDVDPDRHVLDRDVDQGQVDLMFADRGVALAVEAGIHQRELPGGRGLLADDAVTAAVEMDVLHLVAREIDARQGRPQVEVHVAEERVLRDVEARRHRAGIARADLDIDVNHRRIEGARIGIGRLRVEWHRRRDRKRHLLAAIGVAAGEHDHRRHALVEAGRVGAEYDYGPGLADAEHAHRWRDQDRSGDAVSARRQEDHPAPITVDRLVDGGLDRGRIVGTAIAHPFDHDRARIVRHGLVDRCRCRRRHNGRGQQRRRKQLRLHAISTWVFGVIFRGRSR